MDTVKLAIVGSTEFAYDEAATEQARAVIENALQRLKPVLVVSGGAIGIDQLATQTARKHGIKPLEFLPENRRWQPKGFKERNYHIANECTHLIRIQHVDSKTFGSGWTANLAERMGKSVERYILPNGDSPLELS